MANALYDGARDRFVKAQINWTADTIKLVLLDSSQYTFSQSHQFLSSIPVGARKATVTLAGKTTLGGGAVDASDPTAAAVAAGSFIGAFVIYKDTGSEATSPLIAFFDSGVNLPVATNGGDITISFSAAGIFRL